MKKRKPILALNKSLCTSVLHNIKCVNNYVDYSSERASENIVNVLMSYASCH